MKKLLLIALLLTTLDYGKTPIKPTKELEGIKVSSPCDISWLHEAEREFRK